MSRLFADSAFGAASALGFAWGCGSSSAFRPTAERPSSRAAAPVLARIRLMVSLTEERWAGSTGGGRPTGMDGRGQSRTHRRARPDHPDRMASIFTKGLGEDKGRSGLDRASRADYRAAPAPTPDRDPPDFGRRGV